MNDQRILDRLVELGLELPPPPAPVAAYLPCVVHGSLAFVAGQIAMSDGVVLHPGALGDQVSLDEGVDAARRAALQALSALRETLGGSFERLERILQVTVFVASTSGFVEHPRSPTVRASSWRRSSVRRAGTRAGRSACRRCRWVLPSSC